jgi:hypothetical protein
MEVSVIWRVLYKRFYSVFAKKNSSGHIRTTRTKIKPRSPLTENLIFPKQSESLSLSPAAPEEGKQYRWTVRARHITRSPSRPANLHWLVDMHAAI